MVYTNRPITKYCCSDSIQTEARILSMISIINTSICLFILFLIYAHTQSEYSFSRRFDFDGSTSAPNGEEFANFAQAQTPSPREFTTKMSTTALASIQQTAQNNGETGSSVPSAHYGKTTRNIDTYPSTATTTTATVTPVMEESATYENTISNYRLDSFPIVKVKTTTEAGEREGSSGSTTTSIYGNNETTTTTGSINRHVHLHYSTTNPTMNTQINTTVSGTTTRIPIKRDKKSEAGASTSNSTRSEKVETTTMIDWMASFLLWEHHMEFNRVLPLVLWNVMDLLRGLILFFGISKNIDVLLVAWCLLTSLNCLAGIVVLFPITSSLTSGSNQAIFILVFLIVLVYNIYGLWIVNLVLKETRKVKAEEEVTQMQDSDTREAVINEDEYHFETPVEKF